MMCAQPFFAGHSEFGCGKCDACRLRRRREWSARLMLEAALHQSNCFVTLTYDNDNLPEDRSVQPSHVQLWLKRLRARVHPTAIRYYVVGEYGDHTKRPHYHAVLYGIGIDPRHRLEKNYVCPCDICKSWGMGGCFIGELTPASAGYTVGYMLKGSTKKGDPRLEGRHPEFARMSLNRGIGYGACDEIAKFATSGVGAKHLAETFDVPSVVRVDGGVYPLGRYLRRRVRQLAGMSGRQPATASLYHSMQVAERRKKLGSKGVADQRKQDQFRAAAKLRFAKCKRVEQ